MRKTLLLAAIVVLGYGAASPGPAQTPAPNFGTADYTSEYISAWDMEVGSSVSTYSFDLNTFFRYLTNSTGFFFSGIHVPKGAKIVDAAIDACENSPTGQVSFEVAKSDVSGTHSLADPRTDPRRLIRPSGLRP